MTSVVHLMGTVRLVRDGQPVDVGGPKQQAVLAVLALSAGRRVSTDRLVDLVWDQNPPASARRTVQSYVASLRRVLGAGAALEPSQNGYTLNVDRGVVDLLAFEDRAAGLLGDVGLDPDDKAQGLAEVLSTWETPLDGLRGALRLGELAAPFEELRFQAVEGLAAAQIAGTRAGDAVKMLEALVREYPTRENLWLELARGLNRLGRRDAALNAIQRAREALREHLGVHPSALLSALETDLLTGQAEPLARSDGDEPGGVRAGAKASLVTPSASFVGRTEEIRAISAPSDHGGVVDSAQPSGTVTFLFTDVEGSTRLWAADSGAMSMSLLVHDAVLRSAIESTGGYVFTTAGDSFAAAFSRASDAVSAALAIQAGLADAVWPGPRLRVRVGMHLGEAEERGGDYFGPVVNTAGAGRGGWSWGSDVDHRCGAYRSAGRGD